MPPPTREGPSTSLILWKPIIDIQLSTVARFSTPSPTPQAPSELGKDAVNARDTSVAPIDVHKHLLSLISSQAAVSSSRFAQRATFDAPRGGETGLSSTPPQGESTCQDEEEPVKSPDTVASRSGHLLPLTTGSEHARVYFSSSLAIHPPTKAVSGNTLSIASSSQPSDSAVAIPGLKRSRSSGPDNPSTKLSRMDYHAPDTPYAALQQSHSLGHIGASHEEYDGPRITVRSNAAPVSPYSLSGLERQRAQSTYRDLGRHRTSPDQLISTSSFVQFGADRTRAAFAPFAVGGETAIDTAHFGEAPPSGYDYHPSTPVEHLPPSGTSTSHQPQPIEFHPHLFGQLNVRSASRTRPQLRRSRTQHSPFRGKAELIRRESPGISISGHEHLNASVSLGKTAAWTGSPLPFHRQEDAIRYEGSSGREEGALDLRDQSELVTKQYDELRDAYADPWSSQTIASEGQEQRSMVYDHEETGDTSFGSNATPVEGWGPPDIYQPDYGGAVTAFDCTSQVDECGRGNQTYDGEETIRFEVADKGSDDIGEVYKASGTEQRYHHGSRQGHVTEEGRAYERSEQVTQLGGLAHGIPRHNPTANSESDHTYRYATSEKSHHEYDAIDPAGQAEPWNDSSLMAFQSDTIDTGMWDRPPGTEQSTADDAPPAHTAPTEVSKHAWEQPALESDVVPIKSDDELKEEARTGQWHVGKRPGHQGSHVKWDGDREAHKRGEKRTLSESISQSVERVLKKPFRPPKINLARAKPKTEPAPVRSSPTCLDGANEEDASKSPRTSPQPAPFPLATTPSNGSSRCSRKVTKLHKPFKTPTRKTDSFDRSTAPSPPSESPHSDPILASSNGSRSCNFKSKKTSKTAQPIGGGISLAPAKPQSQQVVGAHAEKAKIAQLESKVLLMQTAVRLIQNEAKERRVEDSTEMWLMAGRDIAEALFKQVTKPDELPDQDGSLASMGYGGGFGSWGWDEGPLTPAHMGYGGFHDSNRPGPVARQRVYAPSYQGLTDEQRALLAQTKRNEDGDAVDEEGNLLFGDGGEVNLDSIAAAASSGGSRCRDGLYVSPFSNQESASDDRDGGKAGAGERDGEEHKPLEWTIGTMMRMMKLNPKDLGWDDETEEWEAA